MFCIPILLSGISRITFHRRLSLVAEDSLMREAKLYAVHTPELLAPKNQSEC